MTTLIALAIVSPLHPRLAMWRRYGTFTGRLHVYRETKRNYISDSGRLATPVAPPDKATRRRGPNRFTVTAKSAMVSG